jgi:hypothetical protein
MFVEGPVAAPLAGSMVVLRGFCHFDKSYIYDPQKTVPFYTRRARVARFVIKGLENPHDASRWANRVDVQCEFLGAL